MSLTSFLKIPDVREKFDKEFKKPRMLVKRDLIAPPGTKRYTTIGTAFDYLLRLYVQYLNPQAIETAWVAESAIPLLGLIGDTNLKRKASWIVSRAKVQKELFLKTGSATDELIEAIISLAYLDPIVRAGRGLEYIGGPIDEKDICDMKQLLNVVNPQYFKAQKICLLNPNFGFESRMVRGADADLLLDDNLIDIKTTKSLNFGVDQFRQLLGYYSLHQIEGSSYPICRVSIYYSRFAYLHTIELKDIINQSTFSDFLEWFQERARSEFRSYDL